MVGLGLIEQLRAKSAMREGEGEKEKEKAVLCSPHQDQCDLYCLTCQVLFVTCIYMTFRLKFKIFSSI